MPRIALAPRATLRCGDQEIEVSDVHLSFKETGTREVPTKDGTIDLTMSFEPIPSHLWPLKYANGDQFESLLKGVPKGLPPRPDYIESYDEAVKLLSEGLAISISQPWVADESHPTVRGGAWVNSWGDCTEERWKTLEEVFPPDDHDVDVFDRGGKSRVAMMVSKYGYAECFGFIDTEDINEIELAAAWESRDTSLLDTLLFPKGIQCQTTPTTVPAAAA